MSREDLREFVVATRGAPGDGGFSRGDAERRPSGSPPGQGLRLSWAALLPGVVLWGVFVLCYWLYSLGFPSGFQFDDTHNLEGLKGVEDALSAWAFLLGGDAGWLGRPIALASFLPQASSWPDSPTDFLRVNGLVHLLNGALVAWLTLRLARRATGAGSRAEWTASLAAAVWLSLPILASTSLSAVQRMTSLAATFVLAGLVLYVVGRERYATRPLNGLALMTSGVAGGVVLATLTKENGALLPAYALVLEYTVLRATGVATDRRMRRWVALVLWLPVVFLVAAIAARIPDLTRSYEIRDFSAGERLLTQARALWWYVYQMFLPRAAQLGPFHDDYVVSTGLLSPATTLVSIAAWGAAVVVAYRSRRWSPLPGLAVSWFLVGHSLESTVLPLELVFEHRNYLPSVGPVAALAMLAAVVPRPYQRLARFGAGAYLAVLALALHSTTSLWGDRALWAHLQHAEHPDSERAVQLLVQQNVKSGHTGEALALLSSSFDRNPRQLGLGYQLLQLACAIDDQDACETREPSVLAAAVDGRLSSSTTFAIRELIRLREEGTCAWLSRDQVERLTDRLLANPRYLASREATHYLHHIKARIYELEGNLDGTVTQLEAAYTARPNLETGLMMAGVLTSAGLYADALERLEWLQTDAPANPILRLQWLGRSAEMSRAIVELAEGA